MTPRARVVRRHGVPVQVRSVAPARWTSVGVCFGLAVLLQLAVASPANAWWGNFEKLSGAGPWRGEIYEFRVACFGDSPPLVDEAAALTANASALSEVERSGTNVSENAKEWVSAAAEWEKAGRAWAAALDEGYEAIEKNATTERQHAYEVQNQAMALKGRSDAGMMATSSAGVLWSLCKPDKSRRISIDLGWSTWDADPDPNYAQGAPINLDMVMSLVSWRVLADTKFDFVEFSAGGGMYWFSSTGFKSLKGVVLQPARLTIRAPSTWSGKPLNNWRRWAAIPVYGIGVTMFPAGFEPNDFAGVGDKAVRLPRELLRTQYFFVNVEPFLRNVREVGGLHFPGKGARIRSNDLRQRAAASSLVSIPASSRCSARGRPWAWSRTASRS